MIPRLGTADNLAAEDGGYGVGLWSYRQITGDGDLATMIADDYITDGNDRGLKVGDLVIFVEDNVDSSWMQVDTIDAAGLVTFIVVSNP
jgi:hypothetical protein